MCGIAGVLYSDTQRPVEPGILKRMGDSIAHRGPDAEGFWNEKGLGLVHRRLSIIDLAGGDQPIGNEDGSIQVVFNGEIYNFRELRKWLEDRGHSFRTHTDTEVIVHLYEEHGERLVDSLRGMFAFALWDRNQRRLLVGRDRLGIKPLYLYRDEEKFLFGSELKAILAHPRVPRRVCPEALEDYLAFRMVPGSRSIFKGIEKLPPAHLLTVNAEDYHRSPRRYWRLNIAPDHTPNSDEWAEKICEKLDESVRLHMRADVPVGAFLSGGVDSSVIVACSAGLAQGPLQTFSIGFREEKFSELPFAKQVSDQFATTHTEEVVTPDAVSLLDELTRYFDEPFADPSAIPTYLVSQLARQNVKVVLSGDGGDEAFGGYSRYVHDLKENALRRCLPKWFRRSVLGPLGSIWPKADWLPRVLRAKTLLTNLSLEDGAAYANTLSVWRNPMRRRLIAHEMQSVLNGHRPESIIQTGYAFADQNDPLHGMISADIETILPDDFLVKVDRASMAHGLEVRPPLLDHNLIELAACIPSEWKVREGQTKWIFKNAYRGQLSDTLMDRRKQGFDMPIDSWLRGPLRSMFEDTVLCPKSPVGELVHQPTVRKLFQSHLSGTSRLGDQLWAMIVLARWSERYLTFAESEAN
ncbi:MAG: asparagine synthase (glutamine-hydrolyzing) [Gemmataceae bacterium]